MKRIHLSQGCALTIIPSDKFKTEYFDFNLILPLREETASYAALLPAVLKRGCEKYPTMASLTKHLDYLYSTGFSTRVLKRGENQILGFTMDFLRDSLVPDGKSLGEDVFAALHAVLFEPLLENGAFKGEYVESEKKNQIDAIRSLINNKNAYAMKKCHEAMCRGSYFAVSENGTEKGVSAITGKTLYDFYKDLFKTAQIELYYVGTAAEEKIVSWAKSLLCGVEREPKELIPTAVFKRERTDVTELCEEMEVAQGKLILGFSSGHTLKDSDYTAYNLFNELYGGSPTSKLFDNVREKMSLCYYCRSIPEAHKGILTVASGIEVENRDSAVAEILRQLELTKQGNISDEELLAAKKSLVNSYRQLYDDNAGMALWYLSRRIAGNEKTIEDVIEEITHVTKEQIARCAADTVLDTIFFLKGTLKNGGNEE